MKLRTIAVFVAALSLSATAFGSPILERLIQALRKADWDFPKQPLKHIVVSPCAPHGHWLVWFKPPPPRPNPPRPGHRG